MIFFQATCFVSQFLNPKTKKSDKKNRLFLLIFGQKEPTPFSGKKDPARFTSCRAFIVYLTNFKYL